MKMIKQEFIMKVQKPAIIKWEESIAARDKIEWWDSKGTAKCSFCYEFLKGTFGGLKNRAICPLNDGNCVKEYRSIDDSLSKYEDGGTHRSSFIRTFNRNTKKLLQRIKDVRYEDINWSKV